MLTNNSNETNSDSNNDTSTNSFESHITTQVIPEAIPAVTNLYNVTATPLDVSEFQNALNAHRNSLILDLTNTYELSSQKHFNAASFLAFFSTCIVFANLTDLLPKNTTILILATATVISFSYGQYIISRPYPEQTINVPTNWTRFNVAYIIGSGVMLGITSYLLHTELMPFTVPSNFVSLGAYYMHRATTLQCVIPERACQKATQIVEDQLRSVSLFNNVEIENGTIRMISQPRVFD